MVCTGVAFIVVYMNCTPAAPVDTFCEVYDPVRLSHADSRGTKELVDKNNRKYKALCSKKEGKR